MTKKSEEKTTEGMKNMINTWTSESNEYKEFYDNWMKTYKNSFGKAYPVPISSPKEVIEDLIKCANDSNKVYMSWVNDFSENSRKTSEVLNNGMDPAKYNECYESWLKTYEKVSNDMSDNPAIRYQKEFFSNCTGIPDFGSESFSKMAKQMQELYARLYIPSQDSMVKISQDIAKISKGEATPETYKEFYDVWMKTYKETFSRMFDPQTMKPSKEMMDSLKESMDLSLNLFKSWTAVLEKMSEKMHDGSELMNDPGAFKEFYTLWIKMYEKSLDNIFEGIPLVSPLKEMMEPVKSACKIYAQTSIKMSRMWMDSFTRMAPAQKL
ncbi:MAG: hypothetical protein WC556_10210 [Candidatus Methanoperedens sp.]